MSWTSMENSVNLNLKPNTIMQIGYTGHRHPKDMIHV
jgi:hypothetical protein